MAKKQKSFAEKAVKHDGKEMVHVKFVKSVASNKEGYWRFNESMISMEKGESLETTLKRLDAEANLADIEMSPAVEVAEEIPEVVVETSEAIAEAAVEETDVETVEEESVEDSSPEKGEEQVEEVTEETPEAESTEEKSE
jgi:hypothetical protein